MLVIDYYNVYQVDTID